MIQKMSLSIGTRFKETVNFYSSEDCNTYNQLQLNNHMLSKYCKQCDCKQFKWKSLLYHKDGIH